MLMIMKRHSEYHIAALENALKTESYIQLKCITEALLLLLIHIHQMGILHLNNSADLYMQRMLVYRRKKCMTLCFSTIK